MKVLVRITSQVYVVENVSLDDKCLPLVAGIAPYSKTSRNTSPLVLESTLWFKTLALDAVYIDCNRRFIYWLPIVSDVKKITSMKTIPNSDVFIPSSARPLFKDKSIYDFDASLKDMMAKCCDMSRKLLWKSLSVEEFNKEIAKVLHMYILPSIQFTRDDMFCLSHAKSQIEIRLHKAETDMKNRAILSENVRNCLNSMVTKLLHEDNMTSECYLRNCKRDFLVAFLKMVESNVDYLNIELSTAQNKVNWVKEHPSDAQMLAGYKEKRDELFIKIDRHIQVREAIRNVILRKELTKKKVKKCQIINSCVHNLFVGLAMKLETDDLVLCQLGEDKVNICATRETILFTISEIDNGTQTSDSTTKFAPEKFVSCFLDEGNIIEKPDVWLTFQEKVTKIMKDKFSVAGKYHENGCKKLSSEIHDILRELQTFQKETDRFIQPQTFERERETDRFIQLQTFIHVENPTNDLFELSSINDVAMRKHTLHLEKSDERNAVLLKSDECLDLYFLQPANNSKQIQTLEEVKKQYTADGDARRPLSRSVTGVVLQDSQVEITLGKFNIKSCPELTKRSTLTKLVDEHVLPNNEQVNSLGGIVVFKKNNSEHTHVLRKQSSMSILMDSIESLKSQIQTHFTDMVECLDQQLLIEDDYETSFQEQQELLWKSYEHFFCQELHTQLLDVYTAGLSLSVRQAHSILRHISLAEILQGDRLLDLFFGPSIVHSRTASISIDCHNQSGETICSCFGVEHSGLCFLPSSDHGPLVKSYDMDSIESDDCASKTSSGKSSLFATLSIDEGIDTGSGSFSSSVQSTFSVDSLEHEIVEDMPSADKTAEILNPVLSPFRMHIRNCLEATCFLDKVRYISRAIEDLNKDISKLIGNDFQAACDDIISMLILALCNISEDMFVSLYVNLRLLMDVLPSFLSGSLWDYNLVSLCASYDFLFTMRFCEHVGKLDSEHIRCSKERVFLDRTFIKT